MTPAPHATQHPADLQITTADDYCRHCGNPYDGNHAHITLLEPGSYAGDTCTWAPCLGPLREALERLPEYEPAPTQGGTP